MKFQNAQAPTFSPSEKDTLGPFLCKGRKLEILLPAKNDLSDIRPTGMLEGFLLTGFRTPVAGFQ